MSTLDPVPTQTALEEARQPLVDAMAQAFALYGWPEVTGRIYAVLIFVDEPMSQDDLVQALSISKATVSTALRSLEALHFVRRVTHTGNDGAGGRPRLYYRAERDFRKVMQELLHYNVRREVLLMERGLEETRARLQALEDTRPEVAQHVAKDLALLSSFDDYMRMGRRILWVVQSAERLQHFVASLFGGEADSGEGPR